jgi:hypothetical protein
MLAIRTFANGVVWQLGYFHSTRQQRSSDSDTITFSELVAGYSLAQQVRTSVHDDGGLVNVFCTIDDLPQPEVDMIDNGLSDFLLLCWTL